jgi:hypothetical protein
MKLDTSVEILEGSIECIKVTIVWDGEGNIHPFKNTIDGRRHQETHPTMDAFPKDFSVIVANNGATWGLIEAIKNWETINSGWTDREYHVAALIAALDMLWD